MKAREAGKEGIWTGLPHLPQDRILRMCSFAAPSKHILLPITLITQPKILEAKDPDVLTTMIWEHPDLFANSFKVTVFDKLVFISSL